MSDPIAFDSGPATKNLESDLGIGRVRHSRQSMTLQTASLSVGLMVELVGEETNRSSEQWASASWSNT